MVLNSEQQEAVMRSICAKDYALLLGMPGTGKTTTISAIIKALVALGKKVPASLLVYKTFMHITLCLQPEYHDGLCF
jgi:DNA replication ATP-dependent helicase Dna2